MIVTDTWVSMGQEAEKAGRLKSFAGYQVDTKVGNSSDSLTDHIQQEVINNYLLISYSNLGMGSELWDLHTRPLV